MNYFLFDLNYRLKNHWELVTPILFIGSATLVFILSIGPDMQTLSFSGTGILWSLFIFTFFLSLSNIFKEDFEDGTLEQLYLRTPSLSGYVLHKSLIHWLFTGTPLILLSPLLLLWLGMDFSQSISIILSLIIATPTLSLIGVLCESITLGAYQNVFLGTIILMPLSIPVLVFGAALGHSSLETPEGQVALYILLAFFCAALAWCPILGKFALKQVIQDA